MLPTPICTQRPTTGPRGPEATIGADRGRPSAVRTVCALRIPVGPEAGLTGHDESRVDLTSVFAASRAQLRRRRGRPAPGELAAVEQALATVIGLELADAD